MLYAPPRGGAAGGEAMTVRTQSRLAYFTPAPKLTDAQRDAYEFGQRLFNVNWLAAPASVVKFEGLGPTFNRVSCSSCHDNGGRGQPPRSEGAMMESMLVRLSVPGVGPHGGPNPHPAYGDQLEDRAVSGVPREGFATVKYETVRGAFADGAEYTLARPVYTFHDLHFGALGKDIMFSPRIAQPVFGLGLVEAVPEETILALAARQAKEGKVSGRPNYVWDIAKQRQVLGRFGWKANQPTLRQQIAGAFLGDIGVTSSLFPEENCPAPQVQCAKAPHGHQPNLSDTFLDRIAFFSEMLAVPAARDVDAPHVVAGEKLFMQAQCSSCHVPQLRTGASAVKQLAYQDIEPFTDLLLHDMGEALADHRPDFEAGGNEWRTPPLWGIGLSKKVNGHTHFLHDGRARSLEEAILWHGGEAQASREAFRGMKKEDRAALLAFLGSL
jgi:CxxC motif-containing protein (DUF1111 family)